MGEALVSTLDEKGVPSVVERTLMAPPRSRIGPLSDAERSELRERSPLKGLYEQAIDRESAYERLRKREQELEERRRTELQAEEERRRREKETKAAERRTRGGGRRRQGVLEAMAKSVARSIGSSIGRRIVRGILGSIVGR